MPSGCLTAGRGFQPQNGLRDGVCFARKCRHGLSGRGLNKRDRAACSAAGRLACSLSFRAGAPLCSDGCCGGVLHCGDGTHAVLRVRRLGSCARSRGSIPKKLRSVSTNLAFRPSESASRCAGFAKPQVTFARALQQSAGRRFSDTNRCFLGIEGRRNERDPFGSFARSRQGRESGGAVVVKQVTAASRLWRRRPRGLWQRQPRGRRRLWRRLMGASRWARFRAA